MREAYRVVRCTLRVTACSCCPWSPDWRAEWAVTLSTQTAKCQGILHQNIVLTAPQHVGCELLCCFFSSLFSLSSSLKMVSHRSWKPTAIPIFDSSSAKFSFVCFVGLSFWALQVSCLSYKQLLHFYISFFHALSLLSNVNQMTDSCWTENNITCVFFLIIWYISPSPIFDRWHTYTQWKSVIWDAHRDTGFFNAFEMAA